MKLCLFRGMQQQRENASTFIGHGEETQPLPRHTGLVQVATGTTAGLFHGPVSPLWEDEASLEGMVNERYNWRHTQH